MNVVISGGAGFIGKHLCKELLVRGHAVTVLDNFSEQIHGTNRDLPDDLRSDVRLVRGDVRDRAAWEKCLPGQDAVVHLAAETGTGQSMYEVLRYEQVNLSGTAQLYDLLVQNGGMNVRRIVTASSRAIYGEGAYDCPTHGLVYPESRSSEDKKQGLFDPVCPICRNPCRSVPTPESAPLQPSSFYGLTKQMQEQMTLMFGKVLKIPSFALRYQNVYGPGQSLSNPYTGILAVFSNLARTGAAINVFEDGKESRDFVYIDDVVNATVAALEATTTDCDVINVGTGESTSVLEIAEAVNNFFGGLSSIHISGAFREGDIRHGIADLEKARTSLKYAPRTPFSEGLARFLQWAEQSKPETAAYERSLAEMKDRSLLHG